MTEWAPQASRTRVRSDLVVVALFALAVYIVVVRWDLAERFIDWTRYHETHQVDELVTLLAIMPIGLAVFVTRRVHDLRREVAARLQAELRLADHALHDPLTRLPNRALLAELTEQAVRAARRSGQSVGLLLIDFDRFGDINDTLGHQIGDELLRKVGPRLRGELRDADTVARLGGDQFGVLLPEIVGQDAAAAVATRLLAALRRSIEVQGVSLAVDASVGVVVHPEHGDDVHTLLQRADAAMGHARRTHAGVAAYDPDGAGLTPARLSLLGELRGALERRELILHFQPVVELRTGRVRRVEALVRWRHPRHGMLYPDSFIPAAEQTGLVKTLSLYVIDAALRQCRAWRDAGWEVSVSVNLSARNLLDLELPAAVLGLLAAWALPPEALELEITETTVMVDPGRSLRVLGAMADLGIRLAIDDYGTGYSSLAYLRRLPVHELKIDKSFVLTMASEPGNELIVRSTVELARHLGLRVVAEGVEDADSLRLLAELGCEAAQGYYLSPPVAPAALADIVRDLERTAVARA